MRNFRAFCALLVVVAVAGVLSAQQEQPAAQQEQPATAEAPVTAPAGQQEKKVTDSGLTIIEVAPGDAVAEKGDTVWVHYTGRLEANGNKFDSSHDRGVPIDFALGAGEVIAGWDEGIAGMKIGQKRQLIVPSKLGYGDRGAGNVIPPNATLVFDVELVGLRKAPKGLPRTGQAGPAGQQ